MTRRSGKRRLLVPEAKSGVDEFKARVMKRVLGSAVREPEEIKMEVARRLDIPLKKEDNGDLMAKDAGKIGGVIGGTMVKEMIRMAQESMIRSQKQ